MLEDLFFVQVSIESVRNSIDSGCFLKPENASAAHRNISIQSTSSQRSQPFCSRVTPGRILDGLFRGNQAGLETGRRCAWMSSPDHSSSPFGEFGRFIVLSLFIDAIRRKGDIGECERDGLKRSKMTRMRGIRSNILHA